VNSDPQHAHNHATKKLFLQRDRVVKAITEDGFFRMAAVRNTKCAQTAQENHHLSPLAAVLLGRAMAGASLLSSFLKNEERIMLDFSGNGPAGKIFAESLELGEVRGYVQNPECVLDFAAPNIKLADGLGIGLLRVSKVLYNQFEPMVGVVELHASDITTDNAYNLTQSEQIPTAILLDVSLDAEGKVAQSGGLMVQAMPGASDRAIEQMHESIVKVQHLTEMLGGGYTPQEMLNIVSTQALKEIADTPVDFFCRCSLDRFKSALSTLGADELREMQDQDQRELVCRYCNKHYYLSNEDFSDMIGALQAKNN
jgi:molecular chaperone Hsp33